MNTIPYQGVELVASPFGAASSWHWRCGRCKRQGRDQTREQAEAGKVRHEAMHLAQDKATAAERGMARLADEQYAALCRLHDVFEMVLFRGLAPSEQRALGCPTPAEMVAALAAAGVILRADPRWQTCRKLVLRDGMLVATPGTADEVTHA